MHARRFVGAAALLAGALSTATAWGVDLDQARELENEIYGLRVGTGRLCSYGDHDCYDLQSVGESETTDGFAANLMAQAYFQLDRGLPWARQLVNSVDQPAVADVALARACSLFWSGRAALEAARVQVVHAPESAYASWLFIFDQLLQEDRASTARAVCP